MNLPEEKVAAMKDVRTYLLVRLPAERRHDALQAWGRLARAWDVRLLSLEFRGATIGVMEGGPI